MAKLIELIHDGPTIRQVLKLSTDYLVEHQIGEAKENVELLFLHITGWNRASLLMNMMEPFQMLWLNPFTDAIERKANGEPFQYITGEQYFYGRRFKVNEHVLIPRPETELLVEKLIEQIKLQYGETAVTILDVGTGSGAIAITLKAELPWLNVIASDISPLALHTAKENAEALGVELTFVEGDLLQPFVQKCTSQLLHEGIEIDVLVSNPPYIPDGDKDSLQIEVQKFEPHLALFGGVDGLYPYREMLSTIAQLDKKPAIVAFELGINQPVIVAEHMKQTGVWTNVTIITDYNGIERHIIATNK